MNNNLSIYNFQGVGGRGGGGGGGGGVRGEGREGQLSPFVPKPWSMCTISLLYPVVPANCEFVVNFSPELSEIIRESCSMEKLGFHVPELARNVALQEEKFLEYCSGLEQCLSRYHSLLASLSDAEVHIMCLCVLEV